MNLNCYGMARIRKEVTSSFFNSPKWSIILKLCKEAWERWSTPSMIIRKICLNLHWGDILHYGDSIYQWQHLPVVFFPHTQSSELFRCSNLHVGPWPHMPLPPKPPTSYDVYPVVSCFFKMSLTRRMELLKHFVYAEGICTVILIPRWSRLKERGKFFIICFGIVYQLSNKLVGGPCL